MIMGAAARMLRSEVFDDIYFNPTDGIGESRYVFLDGGGIPGAWSDHVNFHITELGFGTGLNFLLTLDAWQKTAPPNSHLTYTGIDLYPLAKSELKKIYLEWPELYGAAESLLNSYPDTAVGMHVVYPASNVTLMLLWGEVLDMLHAMQRRQNVWYLDGFAPQKNPDMWRDAIYPELARLSEPGARVATFTAAGRVKRGLAQNGFAVTKTKGFAHKRERITARYGNA